MDSVFSGSNGDDMLPSVSCRSLMKYKPNLGLNILYPNKLKTMFVRKKIDNMRSQMENTVLNTPSLSLDAASSEVLHLVLTDRLI